MKSKLIMRQESAESEVPLEEVTEASVSRLDGVLGPANAIPFLLIRSSGLGEEDLLDLVLRSKQLARSAAASGSNKARAGSKHTLKVGGEVKYPINDCSDVEDAWGLRGHAKGISQDKVESYIKSAASDLSCPIPGADVQRYGKTISSATETRLRESIAVLANLLGDTGSYSETPPTATILDDSNLDKAADTNKEETVGTEVKEKEPKVPVAGIARSAEELQRENDELKKRLAKYEREQAPRVGSMTDVSMGGTGSGGKVTTPNLDASSAGGDIGTAGAVADLDNPEQSVDDGEANMKKAVASTAAVVKLATSEEESPDIGKQIARSFALAIKPALEDALKPVKEQLEKIAQEDSRGQQQPFRRGSAPGSDYHLVRRDDGSYDASSEAEALQRALKKLDPTTRDAVTRQLALDSHPLFANKPNQ